MEKIPMTPEGYAALLAEVEHLKNVERPKISKEIGAAREHGDLRENAEYHAAKERQGLIEARIAELEDRLARAEVIDVARVGGGDEVRFGAYVSLLDLDSGKRLRYRVVGPVEADIKKGAISIHSPLGRALIGRKRGETISVETPSGERSYEILEVSWKPEDDSGGV
ncbi:MAG: transcription elongation factor GreA [Sandaracinaceae bacterium]|nr:transcription elongation factor GreA [Sandaracinaceae bacterium]MDW8246431.1 transcription elongation factor GreA [Sandaracinaceae bacterium]